MQELRQVRLTQKHAVQTLMNDEIASDKYEQFKPLKQATQGAVNTLIQVEKLGMCVKYGYPEDSEGREADTIKAKSFNKEDLKYLGPIFQNRNANNYLDHSWIKHNYGINIDAKAQYRLLVSNALKAQGYTLSFTLDKRTGNEKLTIDKNPQTPTAASAEHRSSFSVYYREPAGARAASTHTDSEHRDDGFEKLFLERAMSSNRQQLETTTAELTQTKSDLQAAQRQLQQAQTDSKTRISSM